MLLGDIYVYIIIKFQACCVFKKNTYDFIFMKKYQFYFDFLSQMCE